VQPQLTKAEPQAQATVSLDPAAKALAEGKNLRRQGQYREASRLFQKSAEIAEAKGNYAQAAEALVAQSGCDLRTFRYASVLTTTQKAKDFALRSNNRTLAGAAMTNFSVVYTQLGDFAPAIAATVEAVDLLSDSPRKDYLVLALTNKGEAEFGLNRVADGTASFRRAIEVAKNAKIPAREAEAADHLGTWLTLKGDYPAAEAMLLHSQRVCEESHNNDVLAGTYEHLAELEWRKGGPYLKSALAHIDLAFSTQSSAFQTAPQYYPIHIRAQILKSIGQREKALSEFRRAVDKADTWRQTALPGDTTSTQTVVQLDSVYRDYAQLAAEIALERDDHALARDAFEVLARNRAASLREQLAKSYSDRFLTPPEYFELVQQLQTVQASATLESDPRRIEANRQTLSQIRAKLSTLENRIGLDRQNPRIGAEKKAGATLLKDIQARLNPSEALFSFSLGDPKSFLWAVTREDVRLYDLPRETLIAKQAEAFSRAVSTNSGETAASGRALSRSLFTNIAPSLKSKKNWLFTLDGALLDKVPFADLPTTFEPVEKPLCTLHAIRVLPSPSLLRVAAATRSATSFIGVGDPIYNLADPRLRGSKAPRTGGRSHEGSSSTVLGRIPASRHEVEVASEKSGLPTVLLLGADASSAALRQSLSQPPAILHFAAHVVSPKDYPQEAAIALSMTQPNLPELLTAESAATLRLPGSLVVVSGCSSQQGQVLPGAGLVGLSRGWLLAGASAVMVSAWPTPDSSGSFFSVFYKYYRTAKGSVGQRAALALQQTQTEMQTLEGFQSEPKFWAAYSIISRE
jgi:CHAT domain-containing protein